ncbi:hypothetical protein [Streptomyces avidinii]
MVDLAVAELAREHADPGAAAWARSLWREPAQPADVRVADPFGWDPLIMKFCEFFGGGSSLRPSKLATGWNMPHRAASTAT